MSQIDAFESVFRAAAKPAYAHEPLIIDRVLAVTDLDPEGADRFASTARKFLSVLEGEAAFSAVSGEEYGNVEELLRLVEARGPALAIAYRHLKSDAWKWPYSLGAYLDVLTQVASCPVLVLPHPSDRDLPEHALENTDRVMAITDRLTADDRLVRYAVRLARPGGTLYLTHVEDQATFERYLAVVSRIASIDTETFAEEMRQRLLKEPRDYIGSCREVLREAGVDLDVRDIVAFGRHLAEHRRLVRENEVDLVVMNTREEDQLAMHGLAYPLAVELRHTPLLML